VAQDSAWRRRRRRSNDGSVSALSAALRPPSQAASRYAFLVRVPALRSHARWRAAVNAFRRSRGTRTGTTAGIGRRVAIRIRIGFRVGFWIGIGNSISRRRCPLRLVTQRLSVRVRLPRGRIVPRRNGRLGCSAARHAQSADHRPCTNAQHAHTLPRRIFARGIPLRMSPKPVPPAREKAAAFSENMARGDWALDLVRHHDNSRGPIRRAPAVAGH
jgi:hypothetical protein